MYLCVCERECLCVCVLYVCMVTALYVYACGVCALEQVRGGHWVVLLCYFPPYSLETVFPTECGARLPASKLWCAACLHLPQLWSCRCAQLGLARSLGAEC